MENYKKKTVELVSNLALEYKDYPAVIPYRPEKHTLMREERKSLPRATPERVGISSAKITELLSRLEGEDRANVHSIVITKNGVVIAEAARPGFSPNLPHLSHSMSKSVTGMLILILRDDKKLDLSDKVADFFPDLSPADGRFYDITVEHLLTMSSGASFAELGSVTESEWTRAFFESELNFSAGEKFAYNSMNSYVLMHIVDKISQKEYGLTAEEFLERRLFTPLGIHDDYLWEYSPENVPKGGWGLYLSAESWAKLGIMMMNYGAYNGIRIISESSVVQAISTQSVVPGEVGDFNYGYQLWVSRDGDDFLFNGMLGQNMWVCPGCGVVVSLNSGNNELFQKSPALKLIKEYLGRSDDKNVIYSRAATRELQDKCKEFFASRQWIMPHAPLRGLPYFLGLKSRTPFNKAFLPLLGEYTFPINNQGILPIFVRAMQNNYQGGIKSFTFFKNGDHLRLVSREGKESITIDFGFYLPVQNKVSFSGELYMVSAIADTVEDADGGIVYKLELLFPELPNTRRITLSLSPEGKLSVKMREIPDDRITDAFIEAIPTMSGKVGLLISLLERNLGKNFIKTKFVELFAPEFTAIAKSAADHDAMLAAENEEITAKINSSKLVRSLVYRFVVNDARDENAGEEKKPLAGKLSDFFSRFLQN